MSCALLVDQTVRYKDDDTRGLWWWWGRDVGCSANISEELSAYIFNVED
jgi:hypothetical protein